MVEKNNGIEKSITSLDQTFFSKAGYEIDLHNSIWVLDKDVGFPISKLSEYLSDNPPVSG